MGKTTRFFHQYSSVYSIHSSGSGTSPSGHLVPSGPSETRAQFRSGSQEGWERVSGTLHGLSGNNVFRTERLVGRGEEGKEVGIGRPVNGGVSRGGGQRAQGWGWGHLVYVPEDLILCVYLLI